MKRNIKKMLSEMKAVQIPTDTKGNYWLDRSDKGLMSQPLPKEFVKGLFETMRSRQVPFAVNEQYVLQLKTGKWLINADGDMALAN